MIPSSQRTAEEQIPDAGWQCFALSFLLLFWLFAAIFDPAPGSNQIFVWVAICALWLLRSVWDLVSLKRHGVAGMERLFWRRRIGGGEIGDWWDLIIGAGAALGILLYMDGIWRWLFASAFALVALHAAWRLIRGRGQPAAPFSTLPPLTSVTWPGPAED
jgi:hypothetical protein